MLDTVLRRWPLFALIVSAAMLAIAHAFETFGHLSPCELCLKQREAYWIAGSIAAVGVVAGFTPFRALATRIISALLALAFLYGLYLAVFHAGAEWKWWPGPAACSGGATHVTSADLQALLNGAKVHMPACDQAQWVFLGLSMAGWNALVSAALVVTSAAGALKKTAP